MILLADSGSTKCDWILVDGDIKTPTSTMGFNPFFHDKELIESKLLGNETLMLHADSIKEIYYYGAGCSSPERIGIIKEALSAQFKNIVKCVIEEDLNGAVYATCGREEGIVCILGTGSNSCYYDGEMVHKVFPALGYILGDEGSGSYFGKQIVSNFLYGQIPQDLIISFKEFNKHSKESILASVYNKPNANVFLASYMKFASDNREHPYFKEMVYKGIRYFAEIHILGHKEYSNTKVNFVGSVAYFFEDVLQEVAKDLGFEIGKIIQKPIASLAEYHLRV